MSDPPASSPSRRVAPGLTLALLLFAVVFLAGMALLSWWSHQYTWTQQTSADRLAPAVRAVTRTLSGQGRARLERVLEAIPVYLVMSALMLLPLGRRLPRGLLYLGAAAPPGLRSSPVPREPAEDRYLRCVASRLPWALPVSAQGGACPLFHRQSVVFGSSAHNRHPPRLRVLQAASASDGLPPGTCRTPPVESFTVEAECDLVPLFADCHPGP